METQQTLSFKTISSVGRKDSSILVFDQLVNETIDNILSLLGTACRQSIYDYLEKKYELKSDDVANHILEFSEALQQIFGGVAALLEIQMMRRLHRKLPQFKYRPKGTLTFPDYVNALRLFVCTC